MTGEALRQSNTDRLRSDLQFDSTKSTTEQATDNLAKVGDAIGSVVPGQEKTRDHFTDNAADPNSGHDHARSGAGAAFKPADEHGVRDLVAHKADQAASYLQPDPSKSITQEARDAITPGNHSAVENEGKGLVATAGEALTSVKDAVAGAFGGGSGTHETKH